MFSHTCSANLGLISYFPVGRSRIFTMRKCRISPIISIHSMMVKLFELSNSKIQKMLIWLCWQVSHIHTPNKREVILYLFSLPIYSTMNSGTQQQCQGWAWNRGPGLKRQPQRHHCHSKRPTCSPRICHVPLTLRSCFLSFDRPLRPTQGWSGSHQAFILEVASENALLQPMQKHILFLCNFRSCRGHVQAYLIHTMPAHPTKIIWEWGMLSRIVVVDCSVNAGMSPKTS